MRENDRPQRVVLAALSLATLGGTLLLARAHAALFAPYFGALPPLLAAAIVVGAGAVAHLALRGQGFSLFRARASRRGVPIGVLAALPFGLAIIVADVVFRFPEDLNVPPPEALLFYPVIGYVAEVVFHVVPLAIALTLGARVLRARSPRFVTGCLLVVALVEPTFQVSFDADPYSWRAAYVGLHVLGFSLVQLWLYRRFDFVSMYAMRLSYYACWHLAWGVARLELLF